MEINISDFLTMIEGKFGIWAGDLFTAVICLGIVIWVLVFIFRRVILPLASSLEKATEFKKSKHRKIATVSLYVCVFIIVIFTLQLTIDSNRLTKKSAVLREKIEVIEQHEKDLAEMNKELRRMHEKTKERFIKKYGPLE